MKKTTYFDPTQALSSGRTAILQEATELKAVASRLDDQFSQAVETLLNSTGRVVVTGIGKSGHIARKIAATLASTGTPAFFVHAAEAVHGDLGMITSDDIVIAISYSGQSNEFSVILPVVKRMGATIIALCGHADSDLAQMATIYLDASISQEACPLNLAPTTSTTVALAMGDALAVACLEARNFSPQDFARSHPGGALGRKLLTYVSDVMRKGDQVPIVNAQTELVDALKEISEKRMGMVAVINAEGFPMGVFTDGDLRRLIEQKGDIRAIKIADVMTIEPKTINQSAMAVEAAVLMEKNKLSNMLVVNNEQQLVGALHMHDLMTAKVI